MRHVVIVGASLAGLRAGEALRREGFAGSLTIIGEEAHRPYNRPPLSKQILTGRYTPAELHLPCEDGLDAHWLLGRRAVQLDLDAGCVRLEDGSASPFDGVVIATGVAARRPGIPGARLEGVHVVRTLDDALSLQAGLLAGRRLVVAGAGFIGCEVAASARQLGLDVTVVEPGSSPMARLLSPELGAVFEAIHREKGVRFAFGRHVAALEGGASVREAVLDDGERLQADIVLFGLGAMPATDWLQGSGLVLENGVVCDEFCLAEGGGGRVAAAGDVAAWRNIAYGGVTMRVEHWSNAVDQAVAAARSLLAGRRDPYTPLISLWSDQYEYKLQALGLPALADRAEMVHGNVAERKFVAECLAGDRLVGVVGVNMPARMAAYRSRLANDIALHAA